MTEEFDYVIVGAGTAGCVLANRLSADGKTTVLLLEAGGSDLSIWIQMPIGYGRTFFNSRINWMYDTQPVPGLGGRRSYWPRGKVVGGSGSINAMVYVRGQPRDFDDWQAAGNPGWGWDDVLPWFKKSEDFDWHSVHHGRGGPQHVTDITPNVHPICHSFIEAAEALGYPPTSDFNGGHPEGVGIYQINTRGGWRASTANAFLHPALKRPNLTLRTKALARRILFDGKRADGVEYARRGAVQQVRARREVILSGGAINSPQLLMLSGIGDPQHLKDRGIAPLIALPGVGRNLQDHLAVSYFYKTRTPTLNDVLHPAIGKAIAGLRYMFDRRGPLSMSVNQGGGFVRSDPARSHPNLQLYFSPVSYTKSPLSERKLLNPDPFSAFLLSHNPCRPSSRGHIELASADPDVHPLIHPNYLSTQQDIDDVLAGNRLLRQIAQTAPLADIITEEIVPGPAIAGDDAQLEDFRARADTVYHPTSTCMMGPDRAQAVVDARLRVYGTEGLRVIDASIFPAITSGNTNAPTVMVAEKGAAMIIEDAR
ncbi:MAG: GMC family oxidoreductase N-terminal domain-containing protein [Novosphingobium sp.]|uniref:GMC family oxidoreductase n=1 Tax=Novosphingobium sp. TaxID=1874826 RepID=UPI0032BB13AD